MRRILLLAPETHRIPANQFFQFDRIRRRLNVVVRLSKLHAVLRPKFPVPFQYHLLDVFAIGSSIVIAKHRQPLALLRQPGPESRASLARRALRFVRQIRRYFCIDHRADIHHTIHQLWPPRVIVLARNGMWLHPCVEVLRIVFITTRHPASRLHSLRRKVVIWIFFIRSPWVVTDHRVDLQQTKKKNQTSPILQPLHAIHLMIAVVQIVSFLEAQRPRHFQIVAVVGNHALRPHSGPCGIVDGIARERTRLEDLRSRAEVVIDTSNLNVHQLEKRVDEIFASGQSHGVRVNVLSFGYKYGVPVDADLVLDCRFIPNPHWIPELRSQTGLDEAVSQYVLSSPGVNAFVDSYVSLLNQMIEGYLREGKKYITLAVGCTGGKHRSVAISEAIAKRLNIGQAPTSIEAHAIHRDVGRE